MTDKQIIIDGVKISKEDFIDNFAIELTNCNIYEREQIGNKYFEIILAKEQEYKRLKEGYSELTDIVSPYMNDFTGYNEELDSFDIILCIKELLKEKSDLKEYRLQELEYVRTMLVCLLANEENAKQAHKINHLINEIIKWQNLEDK